jgi:spore coat protein U-like protein
VRRPVTRGIGVLLLGAALVCASAARANAACSFAATGVAFGVYDVFSPAPGDSTGTITYRCDPPDKNITISIDGGANGTVANRELRNGTERLSYNLYLDAARSTVWGDGTSGTTTYFIKNPVPNRDTTLTIHGRIPAGQDVGVGTYVDTAVVVVNF